MYFSLLILGLALITLSYFIKESLAELRQINSDHSRLKLFQMRAYAFSATIWPIIVVIMLKNEWENGLVGKSPLLILASIWPLVLFFLDVYFISQQTSVEFERTETKQREYVNITSLVLSAVFAFGVCLSAIGNSEKRSSRAAMITLSGLLLGVAFVIPVFEADTGTPVAVKIQAITKCMCVFSVSLFILGATLELIYMKQSKTEF